MEIPPEAAIQNGRFTYAQARACGWTSRRLARAVRDEVLEPRGYGVYAVQAVFDDPVQTHAALVRDAQLSSRKGWYAAARCPREREGARRIREVTN